MTEHTLTLAAALSRQPWRSDEAACYGIACGKHAKCLRWQAVDGNRNELQVFIDNCGPELPAFIPSEGELA